MAGNKVSPEEIGEAIRKYGVTTMWLTASLFHFMTAEHLATNSLRCDNCWPGVTCSPSDMCERCSKPCHS